MFTVETLESDAANLKIRKEQASNQLHEIIGALTIVEQMIAMLKTPVEQENLADDLMPEPICEEVSEHS